MKGFVLIAVLLFATEAQARCCFRPVKAAFRVASVPFRVLRVGRERRIARRCEHHVH